MKNKSIIFRLAPLWGWGLATFFLMAPLWGWGQRKRVTATFDADTTRPATGTYGITVFQKQPYLVGASGRAQRIETSPLFIEGKSYGTTNKNVTLDTTYHHHWITGDSVTVTLPNKNLFTGKKKGWQYYIRFLGYRGGNDSTTKYTPYDNTFRLTFVDTIFFYNAANQTTYFTKVFSHDAAYSWWRITEPKAIYLELRDNRWYLFYADIKF
jgi:hypothetical protein